MIYVRITYNYVAMDTDKIYQLFMETILTAPGKTG